MNATLAPLCPTSSVSQSSVSTTHVLVDIEALGRRPGSAVIELAAVAFSPETGALGQSFTARIEPEIPFTAQLDTLEWHRKQGTWPRAEGEQGFYLEDALQAFSDWCETLGPVESYWSWGSTYDFPLLDPVFDHCAIVPPWKYYECRCARTVWQLAFPKVRPEKRPHVALEDATAAARDLITALQWLKE